MNTPPLRAILGGSGHDPAARAEAAVKLWEPITPEPELLALAAPEPANHRAPVQGPHLRVARRRFARNKTGVVGISLSRKVRANGRIERRLVVNLGSTNRSFNVETLGPNEAWKRAVALRAQHEAKVARANAMIIAARERRVA